MFWRRDAEGGASTDDSRCTHVEKYSLTFHSGISIRFDPSERLPCLAQVFCAYEFVEQCELVSLAAAAPLDVEKHVDERHG